MLSEGNVVLNRTYEAQKILCSVSMDYERIYACPNDCILYQNEYESLEEFLVWRRPRYKTNKKSLAKVLWYSLMIPRFKRIYRNVEHAKSLTCSSAERIASTSG